MKTVITLAIMLFALACASGDSNVNQQSPSQVPAGKTPVGQRDLAPDFTLQDQNGNQVRLSEAREKTPVVLVFYRGYW